MGRGAGVVAFAGIDGEAFTLHTHFDGVIVERAIRSGWRIGQGVLITGFFGDARIEFFHGGALGSEVHVASGVVGVIDKTAEASFEIGAADGHAVDGDAVTQQFFYGGFVVVGIGSDSIGTIGNQKNDLAACAAAIFEDLRGAIDGVVEGLGGLAFDNVNGRGDIRGIADGGVAVDYWAFIHRRGRRRHGRLGVQLGAFYFG